MITYLMLAVGKCIKEDAESLKVVGRAKNGS